MFRYTQDAPQQALGFLVQQASHIEAEVVRVSYPDIQYPKLIPIDTSANEWAKSVTFFSLDKVGSADWFHHASHQMPIADIQRSKFEHTIEMAGIGYRYTLEELGQAMLIPGTNLTAERGEAARRAYEEFVDNIALRGDTSKGMTGLINDANVTVIHARADGGQTLGDTDGSPDWSDKSGEQIARDVNDALSGIYTNSLQVEMADTVLLPIASMMVMANKQYSSASDTTVMEWVKKNNVFTSTTGQPLTILGVRGLETAGVGSTGRMVVYRRDPRVLKLHIPMTHRFLPVWQTGPMIFDIPGIFRLGGLEIRRPAAVRYVDGVYDAEYA
jgi:hypothetical protein